MPIDYGYDASVKRYGQDCVEKVVVHQSFKQVYDPDLYMVFVKPKVRYGRAAMPHSEVCMHMGIAGKPMDFEVLQSPNGYAPSVQLYHPGTDRPFSAPITYGEAGVYYQASKFHLRHRWHETPGYYYFYPAFPAAEPETKELVPAGDRVDII